MGGRAALLAACLALAACGPGPDGSPGMSPPSATAEPGTAPSDAVVQTRARVFQALRAAQLQVRDAQVPFRPPEAPPVAAAPRRVVQVILPEDPQGGFVSIYGFPDAATAAEAGRRQARHVVSGPVVIQYPQDVRFVLRRVGATLVFYAWSPAASSDPGAATIEDALEGVGAEVPVTR
jgi:hypothetical protein